MGTTIDLPEATLRQLKAGAATDGAPMKNLVRDFVERGLSQHSVSPRQSKRSALPTIVPNKPLLAH